MSVVGESSEYLLMVLEEERVVVIDTVKHQHVQGVHHFPSGHERV